MDKRLVFAIYLAVVCVVGVMSQGCLPDCSGMSAGVQVPDPKNCSQFYITTGDGLCSDSAIPCPDGNEFLEGGTSCTPISSPPCSPICDKSQCTYACNNTLDLISDPIDCNKYYLCLPGGTTEEYTCPPDRPVFDGKDCVTDENKCCNDPCTALCGNGVVQTQDPQDCTKYYICVNGEIDELYHYTCPDGEHFDIAVAHCIPGDCDNLCTGGIVNPPGGDTTTTSGGGGGETTTPGGGGGETTTKAVITTPPTVKTTTTTAAPVTTTTTAAPVTTTTTVAPTTTGDCANSGSLSCPAAGYYPLCHTCQPDYYHCTTEGGTAIQGSCSGDLVFNTVPTYPYCVLPDNCPYNPSK